MYKKYVAFTCTNSLGNFKCLNQVLSHVAKVQSEFSVAIRCLFLSGTVCSKGCIIDELTTWGLRVPQVDGLEPSRSCRSGNVSLDLQSQASPGRTSPRLILHSWYFKLPTSNFVNFNFWRFSWFQVWTRFFDSGRSERPNLQSAEPRRCRTSKPPKVGLSKVRTVDCEPVDLWFLDLSSYKLRSRQAKCTSLEVAVYDTAGSLSDYMKARIQRVSSAWSSLTSELQSASVELVMFWCTDLNGYSASVVILYL